MCLLHYHIQMNTMMCKPYALFMGYIVFKWTTTRVSHQAQVQTRCLENDSTLCRPEIRKSKHWLSVAISNSDLRHGTLHQATKFQAVMGFPHISLTEYYSWFKPIMDAQKKPSITIFYSNLLHGTVHLSAKFQADNWYPQWVETSSLRSGKNLPRKISMELSKIGQERIFQIVVCFMVLCIIPPDFRPITDS